MITMLMLLFMLFSRPGCPLFRPLGFYIQGQLPVTSFTKTSPTCPLDVLVNINSLAQVL